MSAGLRGVETPAWAWLLPAERSVCGWLIYSAVVIVSVQWVDWQEGGVGDGVWLGRWRPAAQSKNMAFFKSNV